MDIMADRVNVVYAMVVKLGVCVFNFDSRKKYEENFPAPSTLARQAKRLFVRIVGYSYGKKKVSAHSHAKFNMELAGKDSWTELIRDEEFHIKLIHFMNKLWEKHVREFDVSYKKSANRLVIEFTQEFWLH